MFTQITFILSHPSHPGNIGACARAIKTMGFSKLILVNPKDYPCQQATAMASGAHDILKNAQVFLSLEEALKPFHYIIGASARHRTLQWPLVNSRVMAEQLANKLSDKAIQAAILLGTESSGLSNEELGLCDKHVFIPTDEEYGSLNLAQAAQVLAYELRMHANSNPNPPPKDELNVDTPANFALKEGFYQQLEETLQDLAILDPNHPRRLMGRLRRLFNRANPNMTEINILRGILKAVKKNTAQKTEILD